MILSFPNFISPSTTPGELYKKSSESFPSRKVIYKKDKHLLVMQKAWVLKKALGEIIIFVQHI